MTVTSSPADVFTSNEGTWAESTGTLTLTVASGGLIESQGYVLSFEVQNRDAEQLTATTVSVSGDIPSGGGHDSLVESLTLVAATGDLMGVTGGAGPLLLVAGEFQDGGVGQSSPLVSSSNTITVNITGSVDIAAGSTITITGLTGTQTVNGTLAVTSSPADVFTSNEGTWAESTGTLTLTVASGGLSAGTTCTVSFEVQNGDSAQGNARTVVISGTVEVGTHDSAIGDHTLTSDTGDLMGVTGGAGPLLLVAGEFQDGGVGQSSPLVSSSNTITVNITGSVDIAAGSTITITGLTGTQTVNGTLAVTSSPADVFTSNEGTWAESTGTLTLTVASGGLSAGTTCTVSFEVQNGDSAQGNARTVVISGTVEVGTHDSAIGDHTLTSDTGDLMGVTGGAGPLLLVAGEFQDGGVGQSSPLVSSSNTITVNITGSVDIAAGSTITITGLTGTQTVNGTLAVTSSPADVFTSNEGTWAKSAGTLTLTVASGGLSAGTTCTVSFEVQNGDSAQGNARTVVISGTVEVGTHDSAIGNHTLTSDTGDLMGVTGGAGPLLLAMGTFVVKDIGQSFPFVDGSNTITVSITGSVDIAAGSTITITGLTGTQTVDGTLEVTSSPADVFTSNEGTWAKSAGTLTLTVASGGLSAGTTCTVSFEVQNGGSEQNAVVGVVSGTIEVGGFDSPISDHNLEADTTAVLYGVTGGESPLKLVEVAFDVASSIGQSFPFVSASNTITVTMFVNYDLPGDSTITITGLTGTKTDDTDSLLIISSTLEGTGVWRKLDGSLVLSVPSSGISTISTITASFLVQNGDTTQSTPLAITATGTVKSSGADDSPVPEQTLAESLDDAAGVGGGAVAMLRVKAVFDVADVAQSFPYASGSNQITVNQPFFAMTQPLLLFRIAPPPPTVPPTTRPTVLSLDPPPAAALQKPLRDTPWQVRDTCDAK